MESEGTWRKWVCGRNIFLLVLYGGGGGGRACGVVLIEVNVGYLPDHPLQTTGMGGWWPVAPVPSCFACCLFWQARAAFRPTSCPTTACSRLLVSHLSTHTTLRIKQKNKIKNWRSRENYLQLLCTCCQNDPITPGLTSYHHSLFLWLCYSFSRKMLSAEKKEPKKQGFSCGVCSTCRLSRCYWWQTWKIFFFLKLSHLIKNINEITWLKNKLIKQYNLYIFL